jgi:hypothetical protein
MGQPVTRFCRRLKGAPLLAAGEAEQYDSARFRHAGYCAELFRLRVKGTAHRESRQDRAPTELFEVEHSQA